MKWRTDISSFKELKDYIADELDRNPVAVASALAMGFEEMHDNKVTLRKDTSDAIYQELQQAIRILVEIQEK